jgi:hypothetical protein
MLFESKFEQLIRKKPHGVSTPKILTPFDRLCHAMHSVVERYNK